MTVHYAPRTPTFRVEPGARDSLPGQGRWALLAIGPWAAEIVLAGDRPEQHVVLRTPAEAESSLYAHLQAIDVSGVDFLVIVPPPDEPQWLALRDRIWRASQPWPSPG
jgi:L-threonylcarbamoyladenylate synthase